MQSAFSIHKSTTAFKVFATTAVASLFAFYSPFATVPSIKQPLTQLETSSFTTDDASKLPVTPEIIVAGAAVGGIIAGVALNSSRNQNRSQGASARMNWGYSVQNQASTIKGIDQVRGKLKKDLLALLHNDKGAASRLLIQAQIKHPNKTIDWYAQKVIYDIERDRH